jgi:hypothetical protein
MSDTTSTRAKTTTRKSRGAALRANTGRFLRSVVVLALFLTVLLLPTQLGDGWWMSGLLDLVFKPTPSSPDADLSPSVAAALVLGLGVLPYLSYYIARWEARHTMSSMFRDEDKYRAGAEHYTFRQSVRSAVRFSAGSWVSLALLAVLVSPALGISGFVAFVALGLVLVIERRRAHRARLDSVDSAVQLQSDVWRLALTLAINLTGATAVAAVAAAFI